MAINNPASTIPLEDDPCDIIAKAMRGRGITLEKLTEESGISRTALEAALHGEINISDIKKIASALQLAPLALSELPSYKPTTQIPEGLHQFITPFGHAGVNAYIITHGSTASIFDTGTDATPIIEFLTTNKLTAEALYITHRHHDHTTGTHCFKNTRIYYPEEIKHGTRINTAHGHTLTALDVSGHANPARAFYYDGLELPVCIVGDSIFAGSMGGTADTKSCQLALTTAADHILTLPPETVICPGHGPLTTVAQEKAHNAFLSTV